MSDCLPSSFNVSHNSTLQILLRLDIKSVEIMTEVITQISSASDTVDLLILGAGWTSTFLVPILKEKQVSYAATTTTGRDGTYKFKFDQRDNLDQYAILPFARTVLITFPLVGTGQSDHLRKSYLRTHEEHNTNNSPLFIQLGSTGIFQIPHQELWVTRHSKYDTSDKRAVAEDELLASGGCVLNLSGLWGGTRDPRHWIDRIAPTKDKLAEKSSLHMVHGVDVARAILNVHLQPNIASGQRYMLTDLMVYDWWELILGFAGEKIEGRSGDSRIEKQIKWVGELMIDNGVRALPRSKEDLGRAYDSREFWNSFGLMPMRSRV
ncbi:hypothetical protein B0O99DRAFT_631830 [Bisporella sp. PMI_857]|nr:hypothetical protein B0O99DRAFT_631830 [Bisporella sp. PMI_857]